MECKISVIHVYKNIFIEPSIYTYPCWFQWKKIKSFLKFSLWWIQSLLLNQLYVRELLKPCNCPREKPTYNLENTISLKTLCYSFKKYLLICVLWEIQRWLRHILPIRSLQSSRGDRTHTWVQSELCFSKMNLTLGIMEAEARRGKGSWEATTVTEVRREIWKAVEVELTGLSWRMDVGVRKREADDWRPGARVMTWTENNGIGLWGKWKLAHKIHLQRNKVPGRYWAQPERND